MHIRYMEARDLDKVLEMEQQIFSDSWSRESIQKEYTRPDNIYLIAEIDGEVAGYCCVWCSFESADLCNIAVAPKWRKQGVASGLVDEAVGLCRCRQVETLFLEVRPSNISAICLYTKKQFQKIHVRKAYYRNPVEDAWVMQRYL